MPKTMKRQEAAFPLACLAWGFNSRLFSLTHSGGHWVCQRISKVSHSFPYTSLLFPLASFLTPICLKWLPEWTYTPLAYNLQSDCSIVVYVLPGVLILALNPWSEAASTLAVGDVIMQVDGRQVGNDGKLPFRFVLRQWTWQIRNMNMFICRVCSPTRRITVHLADAA